MIIEMKKYGSTLGTRNIGRIVHDDLKSLLACEQDAVVLDFCGVSVVTNSFADEVFGPLVESMGLEELQKRTSFRNINRMSALSIRIAIDSCVQEEVFVF